MLEGTSFLVLGALLLSGCASMFQTLPVRMGTIDSSAQTICKEYKLNAAGAAAGAAAGGVVGHQIGDGNGRRAATALGVLAGALAGAAAGATEIDVPCAVLMIKDDATGEVFMAKLKGGWKVGMKIQFSVGANQQVIAR